MSTPTISTDSSLWPHQIDAVNAATRALAEGGRGLIVMPCGTGKTRVAAEANRRIAAETTTRLAPTGNVLVVVPTLELLYQSASQYLDHLGHEVGDLVAICHAHDDGRSLHRLDSGDYTIEKEELDELRERGILVGTDPDLLFPALSGPGRVTAFATYQSLKAVAELHASGLAPWDLIVVDEAHRSAGKRGRAWSLMHHDDSIPAHRRLYMTATPRFLATGDEDEVVGMDDEEVFGPEIYRLSFAEAIEAGLLAPYRVVVNVVTSDQVAELTAQGALLSSGGASLPAHTLAAQVALLQAVDEYDLRRVITYHHRVAGADRFARTLLNTVDLVGRSPAGRPVRAASIDGAMRLAERRHILARLEHSPSHTTVVSNARVLSEGVDVPELDAVVFVDSRSSQVDVIQAVGRALRRGSRQDKVATIVLPILINEHESPEAALESGAFEPVWRAIRALAAHDDHLHQALIRSRLQGSTPGVHGSDSNWLQIHGMTVGEDFVQALRLKVVDATTSPWWDGYAAALRHHAEHGHLDVTFDYVDAQGYPLGMWLVRRRSEHRGKKLSVERARLLEELGIIWSPLDRAWQEQCEQARAFWREHGHLKPSQEQHKSLYRWLSKQRTAKAEERLSEHQVRLLEELGIDWSPESWHDQKWREGLEKAASFRSEHGHLKVGKDELYQGFALGAWLNSRRIERRKGTLSADRKKALDALGMIWEPTQQVWDEHFAALTTYRDQHGNVDVPHGYTTESGLKLGGWVAHQRTRHKKGRLPEEQRRLLEELGMRWSMSETSMLAVLEDLEEFHRQHGHLRPERGYRGTRSQVDIAYRLGEWRTAHEKGALPEATVKRLNALDSSWAERARKPYRTWEEALAAAKRVRAEYGHLDFPTTYVTEDGFRLGSWLYRQRRSHKDGKLPLDKVKALMELGMRW